MGPILVILLQLVWTLADENVDYYVQTVEDGMAQSMAYVSPIDASAYKPTSTNIHDIEKVFDYIIVGGGSAGAILAARLSEDPTSQVLLLEAGGREDEFVEIPAMTPFVQSSKFNWNFTTTPQNTSCLSMNDKVCPYPRGKGLGGTSLINGMVYARGSEYDFDKWEKMGATGWGYENVLPYFTKMENENVNGDSGYHGVGGELNVEYHRPSSPQLDAFLEANVEKGRPILDYNGRSQLGASKTQFSLQNGTRQTSAKTFLFPALHRRNLEVLTDSYVTRVLIKDFFFYKRAYGVLFTQNGKINRVKAKREVILSAGVVGTPHILMLSGVGPRNHLESLRIPVIQNLPVGNNFQDHPAYHSLFFTSNYTEPDRGIETYVKEYLDGYGPYTIAANLQGIAFFKSKRNPYALASNSNFELLLQASNSTSNFTRKIHLYNNVAMDSIITKVNPQITFTIICMVLHPKSMGTIRLRSADPYDYPHIDTNLLSDKNGEDRQMLLEAIHTALDLVNTEAFRKINATLQYLPLPQCIENHEYLSDGYWDCQMTNVGFHLFHGSGSCKMGKNSINSVVNPELKVHGIDSLRVVDASIFPTPIAGHTNAAAMMAAEKAADLIKKCRYGK